VKRKEVTKVMKKIASIVMVSIVVVCLGVALQVANTAAAEKDKVYELKFAQPFSPKHTMQVKVFEPWAKRIEEQTNGRVKVTFYPGGALGKTPDHYDLAEKGIADIIYNLHDYTPGRFPLTSVYELPFMIPSATQTSRALWKTYEKFPEFQKEYKKVKVLALFCHPGGHFGTVKKPIRTLDDFKGMKFRTASASVTKALQMFGATPVTMPVTEAYTALERGVVDGTVLPWEGFFIFKVAELLKYATEADFYTMTMMVVMNKKTWKKLPDDIKKIIDENSGMVLSEECGKVYDAVRPIMKKMSMEKGMQALQLPPAEKKRLEDVTIPIREEWVKEMEAKRLPGQAVLDAALQFLAEPK
jgi:TRAP-type C4-dicarboxylate transport system substrate-binding protein